MKYSIQNVYAGCRFALIGAIMMGYGAFWCTLWMPILGLIILPFSTTAYFCAKYIDLPDSIINNAVILLIVFEVAWAIVTGYRMHLDSEKSTD